MKAGELVTDRLLLDGLHRDDLNDLCKIAGLHEIADTTISVPHPFSRREGEDWIARYNNDGPRLGWAIRLLTHSKFVGFISLNHIDANHNQAEISFWIDPDAAGSGIVTEAANRVIQYAFDRLGLVRIEAYHMTRNAASGRVLEKLGFLQEGLLRERVSKWGNREDVLLWSRLASD